MLAEIIEQLFEFAAKSIPSDQILEAKKTSHKDTGEIYEDDKSYYSRMALFLEWYLFDQSALDKSKTILESIIDENADGWNNDRLKIYKDITENIHGLFLAKKIKDGNVKVLNLFTDEKYLVAEKDSRLIFRKNDVFQGRIVFFQDQYHFTGNFCFHPDKTQKYINSEVKKVALIQKSYKKELAGLEKNLFKANKNLKNNEKQIENLNRKIENTAAENKIQHLSQKLSILFEERATLTKCIQNLEGEIFIVKNDKIKLEGRQQTNALINKLAYMNLKWERSRQIEISDIYKN